MDAIGLVKLKSVQEVLDQQKADAPIFDLENETIVSSLARFVKEAFDEAKDERDTEVLARLQYATKTRKGEYDSTKASAIKAFGGSEEYARLTANKCRIVSAWLRDIYLGQTDRPWTLEPTASPDLGDDYEKEIAETVANMAATVYAQTGQMPTSEQLTTARTKLAEKQRTKLDDEARKVTIAMRRKIEDQTDEGGFDKALHGFIEDFVTYPTAIIKGPVARVRDKLTWSGGNPVVSSVVVPEMNRVSPYKIYPAPGVESLQDGYMLEHTTATPNDLYDCIGVEGYSEEAIREVISLARSGNLAGWLDSTSNPDDRDTAEDSQLNGSDTIIDILEFHGPVSGELLEEWGVTGVDDPDRTYESIIRLVDKEVVYAALNPDPLGIRPYYSASLEPVPGSFWGNGMGDILKDLQGVVNACIRALVNNMGIASGPQVSVNIDRLAPGEELTNLTPWRIWQVTSSNYSAAADGSQPIQFYQPNSNATELLNVMEKFYQMADDMSLVPRYMAGQQAAGTAGRTSSGLSMLMNAANKGLKDSVTNLDTAVAGLIQALYVYNMLYDEDASIKGDAQAVAKGATSLMQLDALQVRRNEFLMATNNPVDNQITGIGGRAAILREVAKDLNMDVDRVVPEDSMEQAQPQGMPQPPMGAGGNMPGDLPALGQEPMQGGQEPLNLMQNMAQ